MGMQRHLKAVGIFARLHIRDNKSMYLQDIPRTLGYIKAVCVKSGNPKIIEILNVLLADAAKLKI